MGYVQMPQQIALGILWANLHLPAISSAISISGNGTQNRIWPTACMRKDRGRVGVRIQAPAYSQAMSNSAPSHVGALRPSKPNPGHTCPQRAQLFTRNTHLSPPQVQPEEKGETVREMGGR